MAQIRREKEEKRAKKAEEESTKLSKIPLDIESKPGKILSENSSIPTS